MFSTVLVDKRVGQFVCQSHKPVDQRFFPLGMHQVGVRCDARFVEGKIVPKVQKQATALVEGDRGPFCVVVKVQGVQFEFKDIGGESRDNVGESMHCLAMLREDLLGVDLLVHVEFEALDFADMGEVLPGCFVTVLGGFDDLVDGGW